MAAPTVEMIWKLKFKLLPHLAYRLDLIPSVYQIFRLFKDALHGCQFAKCAE
jgi:hypothetical protein